MAYLRWRASGEGGAEGAVGAAQKISDIIGQSNVLLEALGNAKTAHNNNSSRFSKAAGFKFGRRPVLRTPPHLPPWTI